jgi:glycosyltransferase involved in cell wall biosynthesis
MINYIVVNPFYSGGEASNSGIDVYSRELYQTIKIKGDINVILLNLDFNDDRKKIKGRVNEILTGFSKDSSIIEVPDARAFGELIPKGYFTHIRLHCPLFLAKKYDNQKTNHWLKFREIRQMHRANYLSSPSRLMQKELSNILKNKRVSIFPNPIINSCRNHEGALSGRDIDILFLGRYQYLKGIDIFLKAVEKLDKKLKIAIAGDDRTINLEGIPNVRNYGFADLEKKSELLARARCVLLPSRFESFSMVAYEAVFHKAKVIVWPNTGFSEWADNKVVFMASSDEDETLRLISMVLNSKPSLADFSFRVKEMKSRFWQGIEGVCNEFHRWVDK